MAQKTDQGQEAPRSEHLDRSYPERDMGGESHRWRGALCFPFIIYVGMIKIIKIRIRKFVMSLFKNSFKLVKGGFKRNNKNKNSKSLGKFPLFRPQELTKIAQEETYREEVREKLKKEKQKKQGLGCLVTIIMIIILVVIVVIAGDGEKGAAPTKSLLRAEDISQEIKNKLTSEQLKQLIDSTNKSTPEFRQAFASDYGKELAQKNKTIALGLWAKSLGIPVNYQMDDAWEIYEKIKTKSNNFSIYQDGIKFLEFIVTVTDKSAGADEFLKIFE